MKVLVDLVTKKIVGVNRPKNLFDFEIEIFDISPEKIINNQKYNLLENPSVFNLEDIIEAKGKKIISNNLSKYAIMNEVLDENDIDMQYDDHSANTGFKFLQLHPKGKCKTTQIDLPEPTTNVKIYIESQIGIEVEFSIDGENFTPSPTSLINLEEPTEKIFLKFVNTTEEYQHIFSYGILI